MSDYVIETHHLTKYYGKHKVVDSLNLQVPKGSVFALLGRNGAGKTTTIHMILGLIDPTRGSSHVLGCPSDQLTPAHRARIGYLAEGHHAYSWMSVEECGQFQAAFYDVWNWGVFNDVLTYFNLDRNNKIKNLSRGERAAFCLAITLAPGPELLVFDDPALGLDPVARRNLLESIIYLTKQVGKTILFSSHFLADVERVADHIAVMDRGVLKAQCQVDTFLSHVKRVVMTFEGDLPQLPKLPQILNSKKTHQEIQVTLANVTEQTLKELKNLNPKTFEEVPLSLEEAFLGYLDIRGEKNFFLDEQRQSA